MTDNTLCSEESLEHAKQLVVCIEQGDTEAANGLLDRLAATRESGLFQELGKLTRDLHDALRGFQVDDKISSLAEKDIPDAKERLNHVITMTEQAADKTLSAVEASMLLSGELSDKASKLQESWARFRKRDMSVEEFRELSSEIDGHFKWLDEKTPELNSTLSDIMMAQDFQDLTGQIIRRVITLVQDVEESLVGLIRMTGQRMQVQGAAEEKQASPVKSTTPDITAEGPAVPGVDKGDRVSSQDDVDDLLSSLGF